MAKYVQFNRSGYEEALKRKIRDALNEVTKDVYRAMLVNLAQLSVRKVDAEHVKTFPAAIRITNKNSASRFANRISMDNSPGNQSFRALYYEYGTGEKMRPPSKWSPGGSDWNPVRPVKAGAPIYFRDRPWVDLGGNLHKGGVRRGVVKRIPRKNIFGHPVRAHFWFRSALRRGTRNMDNLVLQAVKSVPVTAYIKLRGIRVRM